MLINLVDIMKLAEEKKVALAAINTPNLECIYAVLDNAEKYNVPVVIMHAECHNPIAPLKDIGPYMVKAAEMASVPVCVQLDHGETLECVQQALDIGFSGIMYDGSSLPFEDNQHRKGGRDVPQVRRRRRRRDRPHAHPRSGRSPWYGA